MTIYTNYMTTIPFALQYFAVETMTTGTSELSAEMKTYYEKRLLDYAEPALVHDQFGDKYPIPAHGGKTIEFRKYSPLAKALTPLTEGVTPNGNKLEVTTITATVNQYGDFIEISDVLELTAIDRNLEQATKLLGGQAGRTLDTVTREVMTAGTNVMYAPAAAGAEVASRSDVAADCLLTPDLIFVAVARLKEMNAMPIDDSFVAIVHPNVAADLMRSEEWQGIHKYTDSSNIYQGEIGKIAGVRFVESTEAKVFGTVGKEGAAVYATMIIGANAYATTEVSGGGLQHIVKQLGSAGTSDPLNQRATTGWKAIKTAERLVEEYMIRIEHSSKTGPKAKAN